MSEVLREMFVLHSCSHVRNMINISIDCDPKVETKTRVVDLLIIDHYLNAAGSPVNTVSHLQREDLPVHRRGREDEGDRQDVGDQVPRGF